MFQPRQAKSVAPLLFVMAIALLSTAWSRPIFAAGLPAAGDAAGDALRGSPRHGEWADVALPGSDVKLKSWVVYPERPDKAPVVIVIHEIFGLTDWVRAVADQLAADGFIAIAPDLLSGKGPAGGGTESFEGDKVREAIRALSADEVTARLNAVREYGLSLPASNGRTATVGYCWGGTQSFAFAAAQPRLNAAVVYYGTAPSDQAKLATIACPILGLYGSDDARVNSTLEATTAAMKRLGKTFEQRMYPGAGHGFLRQQSGRDGANQKAAEAAWAETIAFLRKHLETP